MAKTITKSAPAKPAAKAPTPATKQKAAPAGKATATKAPAKAAAKGSKAAAPAPAPQKVVTMTQMAAAYGEKHGIKPREAKELLADVFDTIAGHVKGGDRVRLPGLGNIEVRDRPARLGRNPATGEQIQIAASKKVVFRPAKELKDAI